VRIVIAAVGRDRGSPLRALFDDYAGRLCWPVELKEIVVRHAGAPAALKAREADALLAAVPEDAWLVALDERGELMTSEALAARLRTLRDDGTKVVAFVIGGAGGLDDKVHRTARLVLSLGAMTWPHLLVRVMLSEQLYRAASIIAGHPYHRA
jgi:23S rRNA (pseudouridine1915-N3)-methyltransferase